MTVQEKLETKKDKITALIHRRIPAVEKSKFKFTAGTKTAKVKVPEEAFYLEGIQLAKRGIAMDIQRLIPNMTTVKFEEAFQKEATPQT